MEESNKHSQSILCPLCSKITYFTLIEDKNKYKVRVHCVCSKDDLDYDINAMLNNKKIKYISCFNTNKHMNENKDALIYCSLCEAYYCETCKKEIHDLLPKEKHNIEYIDSINDRCNIHNMVNSIYCFDCKKLYCNKCDLNECTNHKLCSINNIYNKNEIKNLQNKIKEYDKYVNYVILSIKEKIIEDLSKSYQLYKDRYNKIMSYITILMSNINNNSNILDYINLFNIIDNKLDIVNSNCDYNNFISYLNNSKIININNKDIMNIFNNNHNTNKGNIIECKFKINEDEINKNIFLIGHNFYNSEGKIDEFKEFTQNNTELYIDNIKIPYVKKYKFLKEGEHIIKFICKENIKNMSHIFSNCNNLIEVDLSNFNTSEVQNMSDMFSSCELLNTINFSNCNTKNVTNMSSLFFCCSSLSNINLSNFNTISVINMSSMFGKCSSLTNLNLSSFDTIHVTNMGGMFYLCSSLASLNLSSFNTSNVTEMGAMFHSCESLTSINLNNFNTSNVTNMESMFSECLSLNSINLKNFDTSNVVNMYAMFYKCNSLTKIDLSNFNTDKVKNMSYMFSLCESLTEADLSNFNINNVTNICDMFSSCSSLSKIIKGKGFSINSNCYTSGIFDGCKSLINK